MDSLTTPAAALQVFDINELLEIILCHLDMRTLLFAQRVNRQFASLIQTSTKLQRALFFRAEEPGTTPIYDNGDGHLDDWHLPPDGSFGNPPKIIPGRKLLEVRLNPLLLKAFPWLGTNEYYDIIPEHLLTTPWGQSKESCNAFRRRDASWRRMLISQPPASVVIFDCLDQQRNYKTILRGNPGGLCMSRFYDVLFHCLIELGRKRRSLHALSMNWPGYHDFRQDDCDLAEELMRLPSIVMPLSASNNEVMFACIFEEIGRWIPLGKLNHFKSLAAPNDLDVAWEWLDPSRWKEIYSPWEY